MPTLRLTQSSEGGDGYRVEIALEGDGGARQTAVSEFTFAVTGQQQEDLRWYLEDFLSYPLDPAPKIAARIEADMARIGEQLFTEVFSSEDARDLWATLRTVLGDTRVEISTGVREAASIPWELIRDPKTAVRLALHARSFVRTHSQPAQRPRLPDASEGKIRILLVICRPGGRDDLAPFRSVASRLLKGLNEAARESFSLDVLRPPTFERLGRALREAKARGEPYHVVHFDGHGAYRDMEGADHALLLSAARAGEHGYLVFENPTVTGNQQFVDGPTLGKLLVETGTPVLVLNACRSAFAEPPTEPAPIAQENPHTEVRTLGSLAQEVMDQGLAGVVANRYNIYVETAAQFIGELYAKLAAGHPLGEAASLGRKQLADQPLRGIAYQPRPLQDWLVPLVYEAAPVRLFPESAKLTITLGAGEALARGALDPALPQRPDAGFYGRDETLLALDRAFDTQSIVLLHAWAGSGKTATAAEFARWYALTGGVKGRVLFTSFERYKPLARVLDEIGRVFGGWLEKQEVHWLALSDARRREVAHQVMEQIPLLWIWDNVEPVAGFPHGTPSVWSELEQKELADFLRAARDTKAKFLLTSRRDEQDWLKGLPARTTLPPMPMQEMLELTRALARKRLRAIEDIEDWRPLLRFTQGNPLTLTVLVGQALRDGLRTPAEVEAFVARLRAGEAAFDDEASEGRTRSLGASLSYGFESAFTDVERKQLALLHLFQGFVNVDALKTMGHPDADWSLPEVRGLARDGGITLLDRAAEIGLLTAHGRGYYGIHPALPWFFRRLFEEFYAGRAVEATRAFAGAMGALGDYYVRQYEEGNRGVIGALAAEEANLLHARRQARAHGWWPRVTSTMQGLRVLYDHTGRRAEWKRLVEEIVPDFVDPATDGPLPGREDEWSLVTQYRVRLAMEARNWPEAERLQRGCADSDRKRASAALALPAGELDAVARNTIRTLAASLNDLGQIQRELGQADCVTAYEESLALSERIGEQAGAAICAFNLGHAYNDLPTLRDLDQAERWYRRSLGLHAKEDRLGQARCHGQLGLVARERFKEARSAGKPATEVLCYLNDALREYRESLELIPSSAVNDLAVTHNQLGVIYRSAGDLDRALHHYREAIRYFESAGDLYHAAQTRYNVALALRAAGRFPDALAYAQAARRNFETFGDRAQDRLQKTYQLIAQIESDLPR